MRTTPVKFGDSHAIQIPAAIVQELKLKEGTSVEIAVSSTGLIITPVQQRFSLDELVAQMRLENQHDEYFSDKPVGAEIVEWRD